MFIYIACYIQINFTFSAKKIWTIFYKHLCGLYFTPFQN